MNKKWKLVDLPGYGFAKVSKKAQESFQDFVDDYLHNRESLSCVFILIDSKLPPQKIDLGFTKWLMDCGIPFVLVFTKADRSKPGAVKRNVDAFLEEMKEWCDGMPRYFITSAKRKDGRKDILEFIGAAVKNYIRPQ